MPEQIVDQTPPAAPVALPCPEDELRQKLAAGWRCVRFESCFSLGFFTIRRQSPVYLTENWQSRYLRGIPYSLGTLLLGPWGVPWGLVWTPWAIWTNLTGGTDVTDNVQATLGQREGE